MRTDLLGNPVSCGGAELDAVNDFVDGFLRYQTKAVNVLAVAEASDAALPRILAGYLWMFWERPEAPDRARPHLARAEAALGTAHPRERAHAGLLRAWIAGDRPEAAARAEAIVAEWPRDLAAVKLAQYHRLDLGDAPGLLRVALAAAPASPGNPQLAAMEAFGWEECHHLDAAERAAERALAAEPGEPWAHHALAHVRLTRGETARGRREMAGWAQHWAGLNSFMYTHNWWHLALFLISEGREAEALALWDAHVWGIEPDYSQDQVGAVSLLARLECAGLEVGDRWARLRPHLEGREADTGSAFLTLQYLLGLARAGSPAAARLMAAIRERAEAAAPWEAETWADTALPVAEAILARAAGDHATAVRRLSAALPTLWRIGGSHAQRDLFDQLLLDSLLRDGRLVAAQQMLEARRRFDPHGVPLRRMLGQVCTRLGLPAAMAEGRG